MTFRYWSTKMVELLFESKRAFKEIFTCPNPMGAAQFEVSICFGEDGKLDSDPTMEEHLGSFKKVFDDMEQAVFKNQALQFVAHDMNDLFFSKPSAFTRSIFDNMQKILAKNREHHRNHEAIFAGLKEQKNRISGCALVGPRFAFFTFPYFRNEDQRAGFPKSSLYEFCIEVEGHVAENHL